MIGELAADPLSLFNALRRRAERPARGCSTSDVSGASKLWLIVVGHRFERAGARAAGLGERGVRRSGRTRAAVVADAGRRRRAFAAAAGTGATAGVPVKNSSRLVYDIAGRGFTRFRGSDRPRQRARRHRLDAEPAAAVLHLRHRAEHGPPAAAVPGHAAAGAPALVTRRGDVIDRVFWSALGRAPSADERAARGGGDHATRRPGRSPRRRGGRPALGGADEARVPADLLR